MPDSPERNRLYREMAKIIEAYAPWRLDISRYRNMLVQRVGAGVQEASDPARGVAVHRRRARREIDAAE